MVSSRSEKVDAIYSRLEGTEKKKKKTKGARDHLLSVGYVPLWMAMAGPIVEKKVPRIAKKISLLHLLIFMQTGHL